MNTIKNRDDVRILIHTFYAKIRADELLGSIFNTAIPEEKWPEHLSRLTDFWETNLFGIAKFKGNPAKKHKEVDTALGYTIEQTHFGKWLHLWFTTIDELYEGELATKAKESARKMATGQFLAIWHNRPEEVKKNY